MAAVKKPATKKRASKKKSAKKSSAKALTSLQTFELVLEKSKRFDPKDMKIHLDIDSLKESMAHLPTGSVILDHLIGGSPNKHGVLPCPGIPRGKFTQVYGYNSCGKTTFALTLSAITCAQNGTVLYIDLENEIDPTYAEHLGVPIGEDSKFVIYAPNTLEDVFGIMLIAVAAGVDLIVVDSVGAGITKESYDMSAEDIAKGETGRLGQVAAAWSRGLSLLKNRVAKSKTSVLGISQLRAGGPGQNEPVVMGGKAWSFYTSLRIKLARIAWDYGKEYNVVTHKTDDKVKLGSIIKAELQKCKVSQNQGRTQEFYIRHGHGIDDHRSIFEIGSSHGMIQRSGSNYSWGENKINGKQNTLNFLRENQEEFVKLYRQVVPYLTNTQLAEEEEFDEEPESEIDLGFDPDELVAKAKGLELNELSGVVEAESGDASEEYETEEDSNSVAELDNELSSMLTGDSAES